MVVPTNASPLSDAELLARWAQGDKVSGELLYRRHSSALARMFFNKVGPEAPDLVHDTFMRVRASAQSFAGTGSFRSWLLRIGHRTLWAFLRKRAKGELQIEHSSVADLRTSPSALVARLEEHETLLEALRQLPVAQQEALELHYWEDLTNREVAEILDVPLSTAQARIQRGRAKLRELLEARIHSDLSGTMIRRWVDEVKGAIADD